MKRWLAPVLILLIGVATPVLMVAGGDATAGKAIYNRKCATCHGKQGEGKAAIAKMMKVELRHLGSKEVQALDDADWTKAILSGTGKMKPVKGLRDADVANILAYARTLKQK